MRGSTLVQILGGLAIGLALGLLIAWVVAPVQYSDTSPSSLRAEFKDQYRAAIASAYNASHNLGRAQARLALLGDANEEQALVSQAERMIAQGSSPDSAFEIAVLLDALKAKEQASTTATEIAPSPTQGITPSTQTPFGAATVTPMETDTPGPSPTSRPTATLRPTSTATPTQGPPFVLLTREEVCDSNIQPGLLMVDVQNSKRQPIPGVALIISWSGGEEKFFTGLKPEVSDGYADYQMQPDVTYSLRLALGSENINGLSAPACTDQDGKGYIGGIRLVFQQP